MVASTINLDRQSPTYTFKHIVRTADQTRWRAIRVADHEATGLLAFADGGCMAVLSHNPKTHLVAIQTRVAWPDVLSQTSMAAMLKLQSRYPLVRVLPDFDTGGIMLQAASVCPAVAVESVVPMIVRQLVAALADDRLREISRQFTAQPAGRR